MGNNTKLAVGWSGFELTFTQQEDKSWLITVRPKSTRNAALRAGEDTSTALAHIAYTVNSTMKRDTYDIVLHSILFETPGGNIIPEPAITVSTDLDRWGVGNEQIVSPAPTISVSNQTIYIQTAKAEQIAIYSVTGNKLYEANIQSGTNSINAAAFPQGVLFIKGSSGWAKKIVSND